MSQIKVKDLQDLEEKFINAVSIIYYLRKAKNEKKYWEAVADAFLSNLEIIPDSKTIGPEIENKVSE